MSDKRTALVVVDVLNAYDFDDAETHSSHEELVDSALRASARTSSSRCCRPAAPSS